MRAFDKPHLAFEFVKKPETKQMLFIYTHISIITGAVVFRHQFLFVSDFIVHTLPSSLLVICTRSFKQCTLSSFTIVLLEFLHIYLKEPSLLSFTLVSIQSTSAANGINPDLHKGKGE